MWPNPRPPTPANEPRSPLPASLAHARRVTPASPIRCAPLPNTHRLAKMSCTAVGQLENETLMGAWRELCGQRVVLMLVLLRLLLRLR